MINYSGYIGKHVGVITTARSDSSGALSHSNVNAPLEGILKKDNSDSIILENAKSLKGYMPLIDTPKAEVSKDQIITVYEITS